VVVRLLPTEDDINPDGVVISIRWESFKPGYSVFIPAVQVDTAIDQIKRIAKRHNWTVKFKKRIEKGLRGVRVWRIV
jgi:hypothetical protein